MRLADSPDPILPSTKTVKGGLDDEVEDEAILNAISWIIPREIGRPVVIKKWLLDDECLTIDWA